MWRSARLISGSNYVSDKRGSSVGVEGKTPRHSTLATRHWNHLLCGITCVNPAMETDGLSNRPSVRLGNGGLGVNLKGSDPPGAISPEIVGEETTMGLSLAGRNSFFR